MKIAIISDIHLNLWSLGATKNNFGYNTRLWDQWGVLEEFINYCSDYHIKDVVFCGDLFHTHSNIPVQALNAAHSFFSGLHNMGVDVTAICGNHDYEGTSKKIHSLQWLMPIARVAYDKPRHWWRDDLCMWAVPYTEDKDLLKKTLGEVDPGSIVFLHQGVFGQDVGNGFVLKNEVLTLDMIPDHIKHVFTGHYHDNADVSDILTIVGAAMPHNWGDAGKLRGWLEYDTDTDDIKFIESNHPKFVRIDFCSVTYFDFDTDGGNFTRDDVRGNFIQVSNFAGDIGECREKLMSYGARTVEINPTVSRHEVAVSSTRDLSAREAIDQIKEKVDKRRKEVAIEIVEDRYETPQPVDK